MNNIVLLESSIKVTMELRMGMKGYLVLFAIAHNAAAQCSFPEELLGDWTSSNYGQLTFSDTTPQFTMSHGVAVGTSSTTFDCMIIDGSQYILKSLKNVTVFQGVAPVYAYLCLDLNKAGPYSYYYYQNSEQEAGFSLERIVGISEIITDVKAYNVCTTTLDTAEFHTMVKVGFEREAVIQCADPLLLSATYTYTDATGSYCTGLNTTLVDSCSNNLTSIQVNKSMVDTNDACFNKNPFFSLDGNLGCVVNMYDSDSQQYYITVYNYDSSIVNPTNYRYTCMAVSLDKSGTVLMSLLPDDCDAGQNSTILPTNGALMQLVPQVTCIPSNGSSQDWLWVIILSVGLFLLVIATIIALLVCLHLKKKRRRRFRKRGILTSDKHPLGEISLHLDAPPNLVKINDATLLEMRKDFFKSPRGEKKEKAMMNPISEPSLILNEKWSDGREHMAVIKENPFNETDAENIAPVKPTGKKAATRVRNFTQRSFTNVNLKSKASKPVSNGILPGRKSVFSGTFVKSESTLQSKQPIVEKRAVETAKTPVNDSSLEIVKKPVVEEPLEGSMKLVNEIPPSNILDKPFNDQSTNTSNELVIKSSSNSSDTVAVTKGSKIQSPTVKGDKSGRSSNTPSIRSWTAKHLTRSQSDVGAKFGRGITSTRLGSVTKRQNARHKGANRSISLQETKKTSPDTEKQSSEPITFDKHVSGERMETMQDEMDSDRNLAYEKISSNEQRLPADPAVTEETREASDTTMYILDSFLDLGTSSSVYEPYERSKTDLKKAGRPTPSRAPWR